MATQIFFPPPAAVSRVLQRYDRDQLAAFVGIAIDLIDLADGDPDNEESDEDRCSAHDDNPGWVHCGTDGGAGDAVDAEDDDQDEEDDGREREDEL